MNAVKITNSKYIKDSRFNASSLNDLWNSLTTYIRSNVSSMDTILVNDAAKTITVSTVKEPLLLDIIDTVDPSQILHRNLIRTIKINTTFDKVTKGLKLSQDNVENFQDYNEVSYSLSCNGIEIPKNSFFFHESALMNYMEDDNVEQYLNCTYKLLIVNYDVHRIHLDANLYSKETDYNETIFLCFDEATGKIVGQSYSDTLNHSSSVNDIDSLIERLNAGDISIPSRVDDDGNDEQTSYSFSNVKVKKTTLKMVDKNEATILRFLSFLSEEKKNEWIRNLLK